VNEIKGMKLGMEGVKLSLFAWYHPALKTP
jgi:hypothetical protein